jgi:hypothetical protein
MTLVSNYQKQITLLLNIGIIEDCCLLGCSTV